MRLQKPRSGKNTRQDLWRFTSYRFADENRLYEAGFLSVKPGTNEACARAGKHFSWEKNFKSIHTSRGPAMC